jgi:hypothetical protein
MFDLSDFLRDIPNWTRYYTVDELHVKAAELADTYPDEVTLMNLGKSTNGETIDCLKVGDCRYNALVHGFPNSEEPIGGVLLDYLARRLAEDDEVREELDYTWYLIGCSDPDGARLCEDFQVGPQTPINFSLNYYRTPTNLTPEWCFPFRFGPLDLDNPVPETQALMSLMDRKDFHFVSSLHQMKWGGITYQVPHACPELYGSLWESARRFNIFPRKRPGTTLAPGVSKADYLTPARGYLRQWAEGNNNIEPIKGCYIYEYGQMRNPHMFMMIPESTFWYDPRMWDDTPTEDPVGHSLQFAQRVMADVQGTMLRVWKEALPHLRTESPFKGMIEGRMEPLIYKQTNVSNPMPTFDKRVHSRKSTVAEKYAIEGREVSYRMTHLGGLLRMLDAELEQGSNEVVERLRAEVYEKLVSYDRNLHENYKVTLNPIKNNVGMSITALLHSALYARGRHP